jgi:hypothetical protein
MFLNMTKLYLRGTNEVKVIQNKVRIRIIKIEMYSVHVVSSSVAQADFRMKSFLASSEAIMYSENGMGDRINAGLM